MVAGKKMQEREMKYTFNKLKLPSEESHPVTDPLGENSRNPAKKQEKGEERIKTLSNTIIINITS